MVRRLRLTTYTRLLRCSPVPIARHQQYLHTAGRAPAVRRYVLPRAAAGA